MPHSCSVPRLMCCPGSSCRSSQGSVPRACRAEWGDNPPVPRAFPLGASPASGAEAPHCGAGAQETFSRVSSLTAFMLKMTGIVEDRKAQSKYYQGKVPLSAVSFRRASEEHWVLLCRTQCYPGVRQEHAAATPRPPTAPTKCPSLLPPSPQCQHSFPPQPCCKKNQTRQCRRARSCLRNQDEQCENAFSLSIQG